MLETDCRSGLSNGNVLTHAQAHLILSTAGDIQRLLRGEAMSLVEVKESYSRCCVNPKFFDVFYANFLASHPTIAPMFAKTDMAKQKSLLRQGVSMMFMHLGGNGVGTTGIDRIGESHSKKKMNIDPNLYGFWIDSLVKSVKECDEKFTPTLETEWRKTLRTGVDRIVSFYNK